MPVCFPSLLWSCSTFISEFNFGRWLEWIRHLLHTHTVFCVATLPFLEIDYPSILFFLIWFGSFLDGLAVCWCECEMCSCVLVGVCVSVCANMISWLFFHSCFGKIVPLVALRRPTRLDSTDKVYPAYTNPRKGSECFREHASMTLRMGHLFGLVRIDSGLQFTSSTIENRNHQYHRALNNLMKIVFSL